MNSAKDGVPDHKSAPVSETAAQLEDDIEHIRNHLSDVAGELDRRRHRVMDVPGQLRRRARPLAFGAAALVAVGLGMRWWRLRSRRAIRSRVLASMRAKLPDGVASAKWFDDLRARVAETIHPEPPTHHVRNSVIKVSTAGLAAIASVLAKRLAAQLAEGRFTDGATGRVPSGQDCPSGSYAR